MTPIVRLINATPKAHAKRQYAKWAEDLDRMSSDMLIVGDLPMAMTAADAAAIADRAYRAERDDPEPRK